MDDRQPTKSKKALPNDRVTRAELPVFGGSGVKPGVNIDCNADLLDFMDEAEGVYDRYRRTVMDSDRTGPKEQ